MLRSRALGARTRRALEPPPPDAYAGFGNGSIVVPPARIEGAAYVRIGDGVVIEEHAWISVVAAVEGVTPQLVIGDATHIDRLVHIGCVGSVELGPRIVVGERVLIADTYHGYEDVTRPVIEQPAAKPRPVRIEGGVLIGPAAAILPGTTIGEGSVIAAGTVVTGDLPPRSLAVGNPARVVRRYNERVGRWESPGGALG